MANWPVNSITKPSYGMKDDYFRATIRSDFEAGYVAQRPRATRGITIVELPWNLMPEAEFQTLLTFAKSAMGDTFPYPHPVTANTATFRFSEDWLRSTIASPGYRKVTVKLEEV
jgi:hypothetical protein